MKRRRRCVYQEWMEKRRSVEMRPVNFYVTLLDFELNLIILVGLRSGIQKATYVTVGGYFCSQIRLWGA